MTKLFFFITFFPTVAISLFKPWVGVIAYHLVAIWSPTAIRPWALHGPIRISFSIGAATLFGLVGLALTKKINFRALKTKQNFFMITLWASVAISYFFSPYGHNTNTEYMVQNSDYLFSNITKVILFYFASILLIDNRRKLQFLVGVIVFCAVFYVYWGNMEYFEGTMRGWHHTLIGPGYEHGLSSVYIDENAFAMLYVMCIPFLFFIGDFCQNRLLKWFLWLNIPFAWHCIFLTGSRGGLIGLGVVTFFVIIRKKKVILGGGIVVALIFAFVFQSGDYIKTRTRMSLDTQDGYDASMQARFDSWEAGIKMVLDYPVTGVGLGNFLVAYPEYSDTEPHVAHNTFLQFASESGTLAGLMYLFLTSGVLISHYRLLRSKNKDAKNKDGFVSATREAISGSLLGFFVCALFLNLATYEIFYYLLIMNAVTNNISKESQRPVQEAISREYTFFAS